MRKGRLAGCLLCLVLLVGLTSGCQVFQAERTVAVLVRDAETKKPVAAAEVYLCQRVGREEVAPCRSKGGFTQGDGSAQLRAESPGEFGLQVQAIAQGYVPEKVNLSADALKPGSAPSSAAKGASRSPDVVVEMYAEPGFGVELVLPPGYRGLVKAQIQLQDKLPLTAGQRCFRFPVSPSGEVVVAGPALLQRVPVANFQARYANGPLLGSKLDIDKVGFRLLKSAGNQHYFVAGTQLDYEKFHSQIAPEETRGSGPAGQRHKYRYGKITAKNYEKN